MSNRGILVGYNRDGGAVPVRLVHPTLTILFDKVGTTTYIGYALSTGQTVNTAAPVWKVQRIVKDTSTLWADGNEKFDNVWDDRAALSYV